MPKRKREAREFQFEISLSVLNHLGRNLYRNFITVLGEAISNAWDADATNVYIDIDREKSYFRIVDDGIGMAANDFQNKFLKLVTLSAPKENSNPNPTAHLLVRRALENWRCFLVPNAYQCFRVQSEAPMSAV